MSDGRVVRVVLAGDSHLTESSPHRQVRKLARRLRDAGFEVLTVAVGGADSRALLNQELPSEIDWLICSVGVNDAAPWKRVPLDEFVTNCDRWLTSVPVVPSRCVLLGAGPVVEHDDPNARTNDVIGEYRSALERVALSHGARFVSIADVVGVAELADDGVHLADIGYTKLVERVVVELGG